jgi:glycosyltransferase involved in cell wall biosynthesis
MKEQPLNRLQFEAKLPSGFSNQRATGKLPAKLPKPLLLNLGCGEDVREGFINIDLYSDNPEVVYMDIRNIQLSDNSADLILANDVLEHFSHRETSLILKEWNRVLKPNGELILRVPSLKLQMKAYLEKKWDADVASYMIFGGQTNPGDYHCTGFDPISIKKHLEAAGFRIEDLREYDIPQEHGYINLNMSVKARKNALEKIDTFKPEASLFDDLDFETLDDEVKEEYIETPAIEADYSKEIDDMTLLEEIVNEESNPSDADIYPDEAEAEEHLNIVWEGSQFVNHSLALINREHSYNIAKSGLANLTIVPYEEDTFDSGENEKYNLLKENDIRYKKDVPDDIAGLPYVWIRHQWPPKAEPPKGAKWIIMQPWEFSRLRKDFADLFNQADEVWTPSVYSRESFIKSGVESDKVQIIPNGIDPELFKPYGKKMSLPTDKKLKLLYVGGTTWRKGFDILLDTYAAIFTQEDDITLVIKDMGNNSFYKGQTAEEKIKSIQELEGTPEIVYLNDDFTEEEMAQLYRACDILVSPYRGEGFSLPVLEAMASGLPVMVTKGGATEDFTNESFAIYIDSEKRDIGNKIDEFELVEDAYVLEPDKEHFAKLLKILFEKPNILKPMGLIAQEYAREKMTWKKATLKIFSRLDYLYNIDMGKKAQRILRDNTDEYITLGKAERVFMESTFDRAKKIYESIAPEKLEDDYRLLLYIRLADLNMAYEDYEKAREYLTLAAELREICPDRNFLESMLLFKKDKKTESLEELTDLMQNWINNKFFSVAGINLDDILVLTGDILYEDDDLEGAQHLYTESLKYNPENPLACFGAGKVFKKAGAKEEAEQMFDWALKISPGFDDAQKELNELRAETSE